MYKEYCWSNLIWFHVFKPCEVHSSKHVGQHKDNVTMKQYVHSGKPDLINMLIFNTEKNMWTEIIPKVMWFKMTVLKEPQHINMFHERTFLLTYIVCVLLILQKRVPIWQIFLSNVVHKNTKLKWNYNFNKNYLPTFPTCNKVKLQENRKLRHQKKKF